MFQHVPHIPHDVIRPLQPEVFSRARPALTPDIHKVRQKRPREPVRPALLFPLLLPLVLRLHFFEADKPQDDISVSSDFGDRRRPSSVNVRDSRRGLDAGVKAQATSGGGAIAAALQAPVVRVGRILDLYPNRLLKIIYFICFITVS